MKIKHLSVLVCAGFLITGCQSTEGSKHVSNTPVLPSNKINTTLFAPKTVPSEQDIFFIPLDEQRKFLSYFKKQLASGKRGDIILGEYVKGETLSFSYDGQTLTAQQVLKARKGNCISMAILVQAYANLVNIPVKYKEVSTRPIYQKLSNQIIISTHFQSKVIDPNFKKEKNKIVFSEPGTVIDYFPAQSTFFTGNAELKDLISKYYSNLAVDAMSSNDYNLSFSYLQKAFEYTPFDPEVINLAALLHKRNHDLHTAKQLFDMAFNNKWLSDNLIFNYYNLSKELGDTQQEKLLQGYINNHAQTPFEKLNKAAHLIDKEKFKKARAILISIQEEAPYIPETYFELAKLHYLEGENQSAQKQLDLAIKYSRDAKKKALFKAKHDVLSKAAPME